MSGIQSLIFRHSPLPSPLSITAPRTAYASRFTRQPQSQSIIENDAVQFDCEATGPVSDLQYNWLHNGEYNRARETNRERERDLPIAIAGQQVVYDKRVQQIGGNLHIESVQRDDAGDFVCIATSVASGAREASPPAKLSVICK